VATRIHLPEAAAASFRLDSVEQALVADGVPVRVLTSRAPADAPQGDPDPAGVQVSRWPVLRDSSGYLRGYVPYLSFDLPLALRLLTAPRPEAVVVEPPPTTGAVVRVVTAVRRIPYVWYAADVWSAAAASTGAADIVVKAVRRLEAFAVGGAARVIAVSGAALLALMVAVGIRRDPYAVVADKLSQPSAALPLGADSLGRDVLARVAHGAVSTVSGAVIVTVVCFVIALLVGLAPRAATGFIEVANAAPPILAGLIVAGVSGPSATGAAIAVAGVGWAPLASHAAGLVAESRQRPDVLLAPVLGEGRVRIALTRVLPAVIGPLARHAALRLPGKALALAGLGFLGLGAQSPTPEWGLVLSDALPYIERAPWAVVTPAAALVVLSVTAVAASRSARR